MARHKTQDYRRRLRRLALAGNLADAELLLRHRLKQCPQDKEAEEELSRLLSGQPLLVLQTAAQRRQRALEQAYENLMRLVKETPEHHIPLRSTPELRLIRQSLSDTARHLEGRNELPPSLQRYKASISAELRRRRGLVCKRLLKWGVATAGLAAIAGAVLAFLHQKACHIEKELADSIQQQQWRQTGSLVDVADTGINRLLCRKLESTIFEANRWLTATENKKNKLEKHILRIENGGGKLSSMRLSLRAELERGLAALPADFAELSRRWQRLCEREEAVLNQQKTDYLQRVLAPLPPLPEYTGNPAEDIERLRQAAEQPKQLLRLCREAPDSYDIPPAVVAAANKQLNDIAGYCEEIERYKTFLSYLGDVRSYAQYRERLQNFTAKHYTPAINSLHIVPLLPEVEDIRSLMQDPELKTDDALTQAAIATLLDGGPSFSATVPASREQVLLMEDLFTAPSLHQELFEVYSDEGELYYCDAPPGLDADKRVHIKRSDLDPALTLENRHIIKDDASGLLQRCLDTRPLAKAAGLDKTSFFRETNLPALLNKVLKFEHKQCPALATGVVYHRLLKLMQLHAHPAHAGMQYSPTMRRHAASFMRMVRKHGINLKPGCWLGNSPALKEAEADFRAWFRENRDANYMQEIENNFGPLMRVGVRFCGYMNEKGEAQMFQSPPENTPIWYLAEEGIIATPFGEAPESPKPLSPIFTAKPGY